MLTVNEKKKYERQRRITHWKTFFFFIEPRVSHWASSGCIRLKYSTLIQVVRSSFPVENKPRGKRKEIMLCDGRGGVLNCLLFLTWRWLSAWNCPGSFYPILLAAKGHFKPMSVHQRVAKLTKRKTRDEAGRENVPTVSLRLATSMTCF